MKCTIMYTNGRIWKRQILPANAYLRLPIFIQILNVLVFHFKGLIEYIGKFKRDYLANGDRYDKHMYCQYIESAI